MKIITKIYHTLFSLFLIIGLAGCQTESNVEHWIDNPTKQDIVINIDGTDVTILAQSGIHYLFDFGRHTLTYNNSSVDFIVKPAETAAFINPTQSNYIFYKRIYINLDDERATESYIDWLEKQTLSQTEFIVNGTLLSQLVPFRVVNDLFIEQLNYNWDYYLNETIPDIVTLQSPLVTHRNRSLANDPNYQAGPFQTIKSKIFREAEFLAYLKEIGSSDEIAFLPNKAKPNEIPHVKMEQIDLDAIHCPPGRDAVQIALNHWDSWFSKKGAAFVDEFDYINIKLRFDVLTSELEKQCYDDYDKDYTYREAAWKIKSTISKAYSLNFFVID